MTQAAYLILENGAVFKGESFGARGGITGEIVFNTGMTGYLETLTDPSYYGQIILQTFPLIGNYGVIPEDFESAAVHARAYIVKHPCRNPSNYRSEGDIGTFLWEKGIVGLCGIDTRALAKIIRENGVMNGKITASPPTEADRAEAAGYTVRDAVAAVSPRCLPNSIETIRRTGDSYRAVCDSNAGWANGMNICNRSQYNAPTVAMMDFGAKRGIAEALEERGFTVLPFPHDAAARDILAAKPRGVLLSNGPGDPAEPANRGIIDTIREIDKAGVPLFGICLGHQLLALAKGYTTRKMKFGHRGANQPVKDTQTGRVYITSQNHGYTVTAENGSFVNVNDGTCEGLDYGVSFSVQFHPEARGGPLDTGFLFDRFVERMDACAAG